MSHPLALKAWDTAFKCAFGNCGIVDTAVAVAMARLSMSYSLVQLQKCENKWLTVTYARVHDLD